MGYIPMLWPFSNTAAVCWYWMFFGKNASIVPFIKRILLKFVYACRYWKIVIYLLNEKKRFFIFFINVCFAFCVFGEHIPMYNYTDMYFIYRFLSVICKSTRWSQFKLINNVYTKSIDKWEKLGKKRIYTNIH